ncbi:PAQR family membrane homeostasis protein TrhA [Rubrolithibacter danxiaensis]|uniref:PAQR family membrane homeostasis protein TrhA n=1 Tax=Rubrolithibacter danxiaensis TaxID=3390805 RepID=UPI003BF91265
MRRDKTLQYQFTPKQELINSSLHGIGVLFGLISIPVLLSLVSHNTLYLLSCSVYSFGYIMTFTCSTLFHGIKQPTLKRIFKRLDYISIYLLIAGSYTPFVINYMYNDRGIFLLSLVWILAFIGIFSKIFLPRKHELISIFFYLFMGMMFLFVRESFFDSMSAKVVFLVILGVVLYCIGLVFYLWRRWFHHHAAWHLFVLLASICHFSAIILSFNG